VHQLAWLDSYEAAHRPIAPGIVALGEAFEGSEA
jgi:hypothetical protein